MEFLALIGLIVLGCWSLIWIVVSMAVVVPSRLDPQGERPASAQGSAR